MLLHFFLNFVLFKTEIKVLSIHLNITQDLENMNFKNLLELHYFI